jgi:hypothetical protein
MALQFAANARDGEGEERRFPATAKSAHRLHQSRSGDLLQIVDRNAAVPVMASQPVGHGKSTNDDFVAELLACTLASSPFKLVEEFDRWAIRFGSRVVR